MDINNLLQKIEAKNTILFLGSGFSTDAKNISGEDLPTGNGLANILAEKLGFKKDKYTLDVIAREFRMSENPVGGDYNLFELLKKTLTVNDVSKTQSTILDYSWKRIYTTNFDNVIDVAMAKNKQTKFKSYSAMLDTVDDNYRGQEVVYVNGRLNGLNYGDFDSSVRLTKSSYVSTSFYESPFYGRFTADLSFCSAIIFIGYSVYDFDIAKTLYADPRLHRKTFFIEPVDLDSVFKRELEQYGNVLDIGMESLSDCIADLSHEPMLPISFKSLVELPSEANQPLKRTTGTDVRNLIFYGIYNQGLYDFSKLENDLYAIEREAAAEVYEHIKSLNKRIIISSDLGNGKSIIKEQISGILKSNNFQCYEISEFNEALKTELRTFTEAQFKKTVFFVEDVFRYSIQLKEVLNHSPSIILVGTTRSAVIELNPEMVGAVFGENYIEMQANKLSNNEAKQLVSVMNENGLWGRHSKLNDERKFRKIKIEYRSELRDVITQIFENTELKKKLIKQFQSANNHDALIIIIAALMLQLVNQEPDLRLIKTITGLDAFENKKLINNLFSFEFIENDFGKIKVKSTVFGRYLLKNVIDSDYLRNVVVKIIQRCDELSTGWDSDYHHLIKSFSRFSFINMFFDEKKGGETYKEFYDELKTLKSLSRDSQFWLQYAIAQTQLREYPEATVSFETAYEFARGRSKNIKGMIDNHFAKFLLDSRLNSPFYTDIYPAFEKAHRILIEQARTEKNRYHAYNPAQKYQDYYNMHYAKFTMRQKDNFLKACTEMCEAAENAPKTIQRYFIVQNCIRILNETIVKIETR